MEMRRASRLRKKQDDRGKIGERAYPASAICLRCSLHRIISGSGCAPPRN